MSDDTLTLEDVHEAPCVDDKQFQKLVKENHTMLMRVAKGIVGIDHAEEVVQEAWISIYKNLSNFEERCSIKTWMNRITVNKAISYLRTKEIRQTSLNTPNDFDDINFYQGLDSDSAWSKPIKSWAEEDPQNILTCTELQACIEKSIRRLPEKQRLCFYLSHFNNESREDICKRVNVSPANIKVLIHRARMKIFDQINNFQETGEC